MSDSDPSPPPPSAAQLAGKLRPLLEEMEAARLAALAKRGRARATAAACTVLGLAAALLLYSRSPDHFFAALITAIGTLLLAALLYHLVHAGAATAYRNQFKERVFAAAAKTLAPDIGYFPLHCVPREDFLRSGLFDSRIDRYRGEDCFRGKVGSTDLLFSEIHVERKVKTRKSSHWVTVFKGIYLIADFHKNFRCQVSIEPDFAEANLGWIGRKLQGITGDLIRLENPDFERAFKVRASDPVEARYLLTPDMQERFLALRDRWSPQIRAALIDSNLHLAIPQSANWFEPDINRPAHDPASLARFLGQLATLLQIPENLNLNTRLWTKG
jgi:hypothetical protein